MPSVVSVVAAVSEKGAIGYRGGLLWNNPEELNFFRRLVSGGTVIMGRKTYQSIGRPLGNCRNIVVSNSLSEIPGATISRSPREAMEEARRNGGEIFIVGGGKIYKDMLKYADVIRLSYIFGEHRGDTFFPALDMGEWEVKDFKVGEEGSFGYSDTCAQKINCQDAGTGVAQRKMMFSTIIEGVKDIAVTIVALPLTNLPITKGPCRLRLLLKPSRRMPRTALTLAAYGRNRRQKNPASINLQDKIKDGLGGIFLTFD